MKSIKYLILASIMVCTTVFSANFMENVYGRNHTLLNGNWQYIVDVYETGFYSYRWTESKYGFFRNYIPKDERGRVEYSFADSLELKVPGDWNSQDDKLFYYEGTIWYKKDFDYKLEEGKRLFLYFAGVNYDAKVYLNGEKLGAHEGGFTSFQFEITDLVKPEGNFVVVKVDNKRRRDAVPTLNTDWWNFGGITRDVILVETDDTFVQDYRIGLDGTDTTTISGSVKVDGAAVSEATVSIKELGKSVKVALDESGEGTFEIEASPELWCPENPKLYDVEIAGGDDVVKDTIAFRTIEVRGDEIFLNGESIYLRGICIHEQAPLRPGRAATREEAQILLGWAKEMNCNFVRLAHYPHNEHMVRLAEKMGILLWSENPVYWTIQWENEDTYKLAEQQLDEMISRDKNRGAIIIWSMANETPHGDARLAFLTKLVNKARSLDGSRLISAALERRHKDSNTIIIDDSFGELLDVVGVNEYVGWYEGSTYSAEKLDWEMVFDKPLVMSEFGGGALYNFHGDDYTMWSEEHQLGIYQSQIKMLKKIPFLRGTTPWILTDFQSPKRVLPKIQDGWNRKGLISDKGEKKQAYYEMQKFYSEIKERGKLAE